MTRTPLTLKAALLGLSALLGLAVQSCAGLPAKTKDAEEPLRIQALSIHPERQGIELILIGEKPLRYVAYPLPNPDRFIIDIAGVTFGEITDLIELDGKILKRVMLIDGEAPDYIGRMELDYATAGKVDVRADGNKLIVRVDRPAPQAPPVREAPPATQVSKISVDPVSDGLRVTVTGNGRIVPNVFRYKGKYLVMDLPGVVNKGLPNTLSVNHRLLGKIRVGQHLNPTKVRLVLHLVDPIGYEIKSDNSGVHLILRPEK